MEGKRTREGGRVGRKGRKDREGEQVENSLIMYFILNLHRKETH